MTRMIANSEPRAAGPFFAIPLSATNKKARYALYLLLACALAFIGVALVLLAARRSLVWDTDGRLLYLPFMMGTGEWLRGVILSVFAGNPEFPAYSFNMGFGADWLVAASSNSNEPLNFLAIFCPREAAEYYYDALVFIRFYLAALTFSFYCFSRGKDKRATFCGSLCYVLCGYVLFWGVFRHPNFIDFAILLPLVFWGADKIFSGKNPLLFILSTAGVFVYSIYLGYMMCFFLLSYCLIGYFAYPRNRSVRDFILLVVKFALCLVVAFFLVGFSTAPMFVALTSMGRIGVARELSLLQPSEFYAGFASTILGNHTAQNAAVVGAVPAICMLALCVSGKLVPAQERRAWGAGLVLCVAGLAFSIVGSVMNGFGYSTDRWALVFGLCAAYAVVLAVPVFSKFSRRQWQRLSLLVGVVALWAAAWAAFQRTLMSVAVVVMFVVIYGALLLWVFLRRRDSGNQEGWRRLLKDSALPVLLSVAAILNTSAHVGIYMSPLGSSHYNEFIAAGHALGSREQLDLAPALSVIQDDYRIDRPDTSYGRNGSYVHGYKGMDFYSSFYNQGVDDFRQSLGLADDVKSTMFDGVQGRFALDAILGGRYYLASNEAEALVPENYEKVLDIGVAHNGLSYALYETEAVLPIAFAYDSTITQAEYEAMNLVERQEALTRSLVLSSGESHGKTLDLATEVVALEPVSSDGAEVQDGGIVVTKRNAIIEFHLAGKTGCENYLCFQNLIFQPDSSNATFSTSITTSSRMGDYAFEVVTSASAKYAGKVDWAVNLGYSEEALESVTVTFSSPGVYLFDSMYACVQPMEDIRENIAQLQERNTASIAFGTNSFSVEVDADESPASGADGGDSRFVFVSVPFSPGWSATMDGEPITIEKANIGFMAVEVDAGRHEIEFSYVTPGLVPGLTGTAVAFAGLVVFEILWVRRNAVKSAVHSRD